MSDPSKKHITSNIFKRDNTPYNYPFLNNFSCFYLYHKLPK
ncbi:Uncharacterised protein [Citrobacter freundii]|nr:Uncharacterised protein [Citrobacter freundii]